MVSESHSLSTQSRRTLLTDGITKYVINRYFALDHKLYITNKLATFGACIVLDGCIAKLLQVLPAVFVHMVHVCL